jgi:hypothetical protein
MSAWRADDKYGASMPIAIVWFQPGTLAIRFYQVFISAILREGHRPRSASQESWGTVNLLQ